MKDNSFGNQNLKGIMLAIILLLCLVKNTHQLIKCKQTLMKNFYLQGMPYSIVEKMHVCPHVHDKCCSIADEVKISHLWNKHTGPIVQRYSDDMAANINSIVRNFFKLVALDPALIPLKYIVSKEVPFKYKHCSNINGVPETGRDALELKEYKTGFRKFLSHRIWAFKPKKTRWNTPVGGYSNIKFDTYKIETSCSTYVDVFYRDFIVVNQEKTEHCIGIHDKFMDFHAKDFISLLPSVKNSLNYMTDMKKAFYCDLCNAHKHQFFDIKNKTITISKKFCNMVLKQKMDYFKFMHIVFIEFSNELFQYQGCFATDGKIFDFPFKNFLSKYLQRIPLIKKCLASLDDKKNFYKNCWMICERFKYYSFSPFFDGDIELLRRVNVAVLSFMRKLQRADMVESKRRKKAFKKFGIKGKNRNGAIAKELMIPENVDGTLIEPISAASMITNKHYYMNKADRMRLMGRANGEQFWVGYRSDQIKKFFSTFAKRAKAIADKKFNKFKTKVDNDALRRKGIWVPPPKKPLKFPLKKLVRTPAGNIDSLSTLKYHEHLGTHMYPQRSLFLNRGDEQNPENVANKMDISTDEKSEMMKSYGYTAPQERRLMLTTDDGKNSYKVSKVSKKKKSDRSLWWRRKKRRRRRRRRFFRRRKSAAQLRREKIQRERNDENRRKREEIGFRNRDMNRLRRTRSPRLRKIAAKKPLLIRRKNAERNRNYHRIRGYKNGGLPHHVLKKMHPVNRKYAILMGSVNKVKAHKAHMKKKYVAADTKADLARVRARDKKRGIPFINVKKPKDSRKKKKIKGYHDFYSKPQKHKKRKMRKKKRRHPLPQALFVENLNQIFERVEAKVDIKEFVNVYEKDGLNPIHNLELINFKFNITKLIEERYKIPEKLVASTVYAYTGLNKELLKEFNTDLDVDIEVYEDVNDMMIEVNRYKQLRRKVMEHDNNPILIHKLNVAIDRLQKLAKENQARKEKVKKAMRARRNRKGHTDLNKNKYPDYHHHHDLYFNDTFHGIAEMFSHIFGS